MKLLPLLCTLVFALGSASVLGLAGGGESPSQSSARVSSPRERQQMVQRLDAMEAALDALEEALRAGSVDGQQRQIADLRRQVADMRSELSRELRQRLPGSEPSR